MAWWSLHGFVLAGIDLYGVMFSLCGFEWRLYGSMYRLMLIKLHFDMCVFISAVVMMCPTSLPLALFRGQRMHSLTWDSVHSGN